MSEQNEHPAGSGAALLIIDMVNDLDFPSGAKLLEPATAAAERIERLREAADRRRVPVIYVNDNFGQWHSERSRLVEHAGREGVRGRDIVERLKPREDDFFIIKPQHSGFYSTNLPVVLPKLGATRLIMTGVAADMCVLFTAADAHMREYQIWAPRDCVAAAADERRDWALEIMATAMHAETRSSEDLSLDDWLQG